MSEDTEAKDEDREEVYTVSTFDIVFFRLTKVVGLILGSAIMGYETVADHTDRPYLYAAALMMMGLQIAEMVEKIASGLGGGSRQKISHMGKDLDKRPK